MITLLARENSPNSKSCRFNGGFCRLFKPSDSDLDPHGNLAKVDNEDVASYHKEKSTEEHR